LSHQFRLLAKSIMVKDFRKSIAF